MQRIKMETGAAISSGAATAVLVSIEGGNCRLYAGNTLIRFMPPFGMFNDKETYGIVFEGA